MYTNVILPRQWCRLACLCRYSTIEGQKLPQHGKSSDGIAPPVRIPRGPTDILEALASTVGPDPTAAHYKYHDDPYLIPLSNFRKRAYALSAEAGRKAAAWVRDEHADLFTLRTWDQPLKKQTPHFNADPHIDAFAPKPIYNDESKVTEQDLEYTIKNALVEDSIKIFQLLGGVEGVNDELKLKFLQLLCFYNEKEPDSMEWLEERWFATSSKERQSTTWKLGGLAEKIFNGMEPKTPEAYCAIIQGMAKYYQAERAHSLAQEASEKGIQLSTDVYNSLLACVGFLREGVTLRTEALKATLMQMQQQGISSNQETLSACLRSVSAWGGGRALQQLAADLLAEFRVLGIQPGLSAYYYLLCLYCKERGPRVDILSPILSDLEKREKLEALEPTDSNFFITAMGVSSDHLQDVAMAERVHALVLRGAHYKLLGDAYKESIYYRHYVTAACRHAPFEKTTELLDSLIPNVYSPEPSVMEEIIKTLELGGAGDRLSQAWSQLVVFGHARRARLVERLLSAMCNVYDYQEPEIKEKMRAAASDILKFGQISEEEMATKELRSPPNKYSAEALCNVIQLCSDVVDKDDPSWTTVTDALNKLRKEQAVGVPSRPEVLAAVANNAAGRGKPGIAAMALSYLAECGFEEASTASVKVLATILNRDEKEVSQLLSEPRAAVEAALQPAALEIFDAYRLATTEGPRRREKEDTTSSSSDSDSDSD